MCILGAILLISSLAGCADNSESNPVKVNKAEQAKATRDMVKALMASNPCGVLSVQRPLVNITGHLTAMSNASSRQLFLYLASNRSLDSVLWAVDHCRYLARTKITDDGGFQFLDLPAGNYSVFFRRSPDESVQGFPVIDEQNVSTHTVEMLWHGRDQSHSIGVFAIQARVD